MTMPAVANGCATGESTVVASSSGLGRRSSTCTTTGLDGSGSAFRALSRAACSRAARSLALSALSLFSSPP